jgi:hypothetical protein
MQKIISLFQRNYGTDYKVRDEVVPGAEWVIDGEGVATRKWDGTCSMIKGGALHKRHEAQTVEMAPKHFIPAQEPDPITGKWPGWLPCIEGEAADKWFIEGFKWLCELYKGNPADGTYELCGPRINGNPEGFEEHRMIPHGADHVVEPPRTFAHLKEYFEKFPTIEGIVWHHTDGRMVKIKARDFGIKRRK